MGGVAGDDRRLECDVRGLQQRRGRGEHMLSGLMAGTVDQAGIGCEHHFVQVRRILHVQQHGLDLEARLPHPDHVTHGVERMFASIKGQQDADHQRFSLGTMDRAHRSPARLRMQVEWHKESRERQWGRKEIARSGGGGDEP